MFFRSQVSWFPSRAGADKKIKVIKTRLEGGTTIEIEKYFIVGRCKDFTKHVFELANFHGLQKVNERKCRVRIYR